MTLSLKKKIHFIGSKVGSSIPRLKNLNIPKSPLYEISVNCIYHTLHTNTNTFSAKQIQTGKETLKGHFSKLNTNYSFLDEQTPTHKCNN